MTTSTVSRLGRAPEEGIKAPVITTSVINITLNGTGQTIGLPGVLVSTGQRVLAAAQTVPAENGIYIVGPNDWERASDMNADNDVSNGQLVLSNNNSLLYQTVVTGPWTPGSTPITFTELVGGMPASIVLTLPNPIDLVDTTVALNVGAADPDTEPHIEVDFQAIQSKADATTAAPLFLNPLGGPVTIGDDLNISGAPARINLINTSAAVDEGYTRLAPNVYRIFDDALANFYEYFRTTRSGVGAGVQVDTIAFTSVTSINLVSAAVQANGTQVSVVGHTHVATDITDFMAAVVAIIGVTAPPAHTHVAADVTDFQAAVAANAAVALNTAKVTNVPTALALGTRTITTMPIDSDSGAGDVVLPVFSSTLAGLVPGSGGGTANFQRADGTWAVPPGTGGSNFTAVVETTTSRTAAAFEAVFVDDDTAGGVVTITLPAGSADDQILVKKLGTTANVILDGDSAETIDGATTFTLTAQYASLMLMWNGTEWSII